ncbi:GNAT family N-acetyltransferase [Clostridium sardiniense]|nr:GNAT family N-acetyltransferase [Clostridium sardiniense]MDQ0459253.1 ribosomal protein S18 acetylase RimI-like enzyme [Clostridium sardiniense]
MGKVKYREIIKDDYETIKNMIGEAFGFNEFIDDAKVLDIALSSYLDICILESSFSKVAEKDNKIIGFILGNAKKDTNRVDDCSSSVELNSSEIESIMSKGNTMELLKEFSKITDAYKELIEGKKDNFQGCIQLFIVSKESRGLGIGKSLLGYLFDYMKSMDVKSLYVYTDTRCNYKFYDSQNFKLINEKKIYFNTLNMDLDVFLYEYEF